MRAIVSFLLYLIDFFIVFIIMVFHSSFDMNCMFSDKNVKVKIFAKNSEKKTKLKTI